MIGEQTLGLINIPKPVKKERLLKNPDNMMALYLRLQNVYRKRPEMDEFVGAMAGTKFAQDYTPEEIKKDEQYVETTRGRIEEFKRSKGQENLDDSEEGSAFAEAGQAMVADCLNTWLLDSQTIMTADRDDLKVGIDLVTKDRNGGHFGTAFDATVSSNPAVIQKKIQSNWDNNVVRGSLPVVKYYKDPNNGELGRITVPKFIIGVSADSINEMANAYLSGTERDLDKHPVRKLILEQITTQIEGVLDFYEDKKDDPQYSFAYRQYVRVDKTIKEALKELNEAQIIDRLEYHEYSKNSLTMNLINDFVNSKKKI